MANPITEESLKYLFCGSNKEKNGCGGWISLGPSRASPFAFAAGDPLRFPCKTAIMAVL